MEQELEVTNTAPEAPTPTPSVEKTPEQTGAAPEVEKKPDPKDRQAVIKHALEKSKKEAAERVNAAGRKIGPDGKFVPEKQKEEAAPPAASAPQAPAAAAPLNAPAGLMASLKAQWATLPRHVQEELIRLDKTAAEAAGKAAQPYAEKAKQADELMAVIQPYMPMIQAEGGTPARAISDLLRTAALLRTGTPQQKTILFHQLAQQFGVQLQQPTQGQPGQFPDISQHPLVQQLAGTVQELRGAWTQQTQAQQQAAQQASTKAVTEFLNEVDDKGQPKFPLDNTLDESFVAEIQLSRSQHPDWAMRQLLEHAYENLVWKTPQLRELRLQKQEEERKRKEQEALAAKKAAAVSVKGTGPSNAGPPSIDPKDRRAVIANAMASIRR